MNKMEETAKNWQVSALEKRLEQQERFNLRIEDKLDKILLNQTTPQQLEERIASLTKSFDDKLTGQIDKINLKYGPLADTIKWVTRSLVLLVAAQVVIILFNFLKAHP